MQGKIYHLLHCWSIESASNRHLEARQLWTDDTAGLAGILGVGDQHGCIACSETDNGVSINESAKELLKSLALTLPGSGTGAVVNDCMERVRSSAQVLPLR